MTRFLFPFAFAAVFCPAGMVYAQSSGDLADITAPPTQPVTATGCKDTRRAALRTAASVEARLRDGDAETRREILLKLLMSADAEALFPCLPEPGTAD